MMLQFEKSMKKDQQDEPLVNNVQSVNQPVADENIPLRSARSIAYTVSWLDGKAERFQFEVFHTVAQGMEQFKKI